MNAKSNLTDDFSKVVVPLMKKTHDMKNTPIRGMARESYPICSILAVLSFDIYPT